MQCPDQTEKSAAEEGERGWLGDDVDDVGGAELETLDNPQVLTIRIHNVAGISIDVYNYISKPGCFDAENGEVKGAGLPYGMVVAVPLINMAAL